MKLIGKIYKFKYNCLKKNYYIDLLVVLYFYILLINKRIDNMFNMEIVVYF